jgi:hypothetical protein
MQLIDPRLEFAKPLIDHWCSIRGGELVPRQENLRPTTLQQILPMMQLLDISTAREAFIALMGKRISSCCRAMVAMRRKLNDQIRLHRQTWLRQASLLLRPQARERRHHLREARYTA